MSVFLRKYGTGTGADVWIPLIKRAVVDFAVGADFTPAAGDVKITKDGGATANIGTLPVVLAMGNTALWKFVLADAELQAKVIVVTVSDAATKAVEDQSFIIETYGNASAKFQADLSAANLPAAANTIANDAITAAAIANSAIDEATFAADTAKYQAKLWIFDDNANTNDRYVVIWFKNGEPVTSGITSPTIQVIKAIDGTDLVASTAMTQIGSTGHYRYNEGTNRIVDGAAYVAKVQASIDSATRTWPQPVGRDS